VHQVDERYSSVEAAAHGAIDLDAEAARLIAEQFLRGLALGAVDASLQSVHPPLADAETNDHTQH
jgi:hypothetical protein